MRDRWMSEYGHSWGCGAPPQSVDSHQHYNIVLPYNSTNGEYYQSGLWKTLQTGPANIFPSYSFFILWTFFVVKYFLINKRSWWRGWWEPLGVTNVVTMGLLMSFVYPQHLLSLSSPVSTTTTTTVSCHLPRISTLRKFTVSCWVWQKPKKKKRYPDPIQC